jgi:hypothetical protein
MQINDPQVLAEITAVFHIYEKALLANDTAALDAMFLNSDVTVRYGVADLQHGIDEVRAFRAVQQPFERTLSRTVITTYGSDVAVASTLFRRPDFPGEVGRQMQTWIRTEDGWKVAAAHVSQISATSI